MSFSSSPFSASAFSDLGAPVSVDVTVFIDVQTPPVQATGQVDSVTASIPVTVLLSGWGFGAWNQNSWGVNATQPEATGAVGTVDIHNDMSVGVTGVEARGSLGIGWGGGAWGSNAWNAPPITVEAGTGVSVTIVQLVEATGQVDNGTTVIEGQFGEIDVSGVGAVGELGENYSISLGVSTSPNGLQAIGQVDNNTLTVVEGQGISTSPNGLQAIGQVDNNTLTVVTGATISVVEGLEGTGFTNQVSIEIDKIVNVTGVSASGFVANVLVWGNIIPNPGTVWSNIGPSQGTGYNPVTINQTPNWSSISTSQTPNYSVISTNQTPNWEDIAA
jgi:hypothetical protein